MNNIFTFDDYKAAPTLVVPHTHPNGIIKIVDIGSCCLKCGKDLQHLRGVFDDHAVCVEANFAGICEDCKIIVTCKLRFYEDGRFMHWDGDEWQTYRIKKKLWDKIKEFFGL